MFKTDEQIIEEEKEKQKKRIFVEGILRILDEKSSKELEEIYIHIKKLKRS